MKGQNDFRVMTQISSSISAKNRILESGVFNEQGNPLFRSALIELLIVARDLTHKSYLKGHEVNFIDDVAVKGKVTNVSMLIKYARDAVCHIDSDNHKSIESDSVFSFNTMFGKGKLASINGVDFSSDYQDDICVFFGDQKIYIKRHILRAIDEATHNLRSAYRNSPYAHFLS